MKRKYRSNCPVCGKPLISPHSWRFGGMFGRGRCVHGKKKIIYPTRSRYVKSRHGDWWYWKSGPWGTDVLDLEWREKMERKWRKRAGIRKKLDIERRG